MIKHKLNKRQTFIYSILFTFLLPLSALYLFLIFRASFIQLKFISIVYSLTIITVLLSLQIKCSWINSPQVSENFKTEYFTNTAHELRTPLTVILGAIQLMEQKTAASSVENSKHNNHLYTIKQNCYRLLRLTNNILDLTKIQSGHINLNTEICNIVALVEEIAQSVAPYAEQKGLILEFNSSQKQIVTAVDIDKIEKIVLNLLSNAIKFTEPGGKINININSKGGNIHMSFRDTGLGIPPSMHKAVFERYRQVNSSLSIKNEGSGIGLSLVKYFVELHNGSITLDSEENKGSEFVVRLPVTTVNEEHNNVCSKEDTYSRVIKAIKVEFSDIYSAV